MEFRKVSIFQLLTTIEQILKSYQQNSFDKDQLSSIFQELRQIQISPELFFQQLIPNEDRILELKYTLYQQILKNIPESSTLNLSIENLQRISYNEDSFVNVEDISEILRKISAIKGEIMFINQQLSIQKIEDDLDHEIKRKLNEISLRKLIKEYMKKCRPTSKLQFLTPVCIRLVVLQESILVYLEKTLTLFCSILNQESEYIVEEHNTTSQSVKSVSSLSASIEQFLSKQTKNDSSSAMKTSMEVLECPTFQPIIRSDFILDRTQTEEVYITVNHEARRKNCCLWF